MIKDIILNTFLISILEETFLMLFIFFLFKDLKSLTLDDSKRYIKRIFFIGVLPAALISNYLLVSEVLGENLRFFLNALTIFLLMLIVLESRLNQYRDAFLILSYTIISLLSVLIGDFLMLVVLKAGFNISILDIQENRFSLFFVATPNRTLQFISLSLFYIIKNNIKIRGKGFILLYTLGFVVISLISINYIAKYGVYLENASIPLMILIGLLLILLCIIPIVFIYKNHLRITSKNSDLQSIDVI